MNPFRWNAAETVNLTASSTIARVAISKPSKGPQQIRVVFVGTGTAFIRAGTDNTVISAAATDMPVIAGSVEVLTLQHTPDASFTHIAAITVGSDTGTLYITTGEGV